MVAVVEEEEEDIYSTMEQGTTRATWEMDSIITALTVSRSPLLASSLPDELAETVGAFNAYLSVKDSLGAVEAYFAVPSAFLKVFKGSEGQVPLLYALGKQAYHLTLASKSPLLAEECARLLLRLLTACITEKQERICKRAGAYLMASLLLRCYFHGVKQTSLIGNVVRVMGQCDLPPVECFPKAHVCMYKYYLSRYLIGKGLLEEALEQLEWIYLRLSGFEQGKRNFERVLELLVPLKLLLQQKWPLRGHRSALLKALWNGQVQKYRQSCAHERPVLLQQGTFLLYQRLQLLALKQLLKRLQHELNGGTRIPLRLIEAGAGEEGASGLVELIAGGAVRGYLSEEHGYLVLSAQNPFPSCAIN